MKAVVLILLCCCLTGCGRRGPSYESRFHDSILVDFPPGHPDHEIERIRKHIDTNLRSSAHGFFSGVMTGSGQIDFMTIDTDFELVDERAMIEGFIADGVLPKEVKIEYRRAQQEP